MSKYKKGDKVIAVEDYEEQITKGTVYEVGDVQGVYLYVPNNMGAVGGFHRRRFQPVAEAKPDAVYHPPHYARWKMEPIEFIAINNLPWWLANLIKYSMRFDAKDGLQDLYKARSYLDMKIREVEGHPRFWDKPVTEERVLNGTKWPALTVGPQADGL